MIVVKAVVRRYEGNSEQYSDYNISDQTVNHLSDRNQGIMCYTEYLSQEPKIHARSSYLTPSSDSHL